jgi:hypothetical protein
MPITLDGTNGITQAGEFNSDSSFGFKNRIINGAMVIDQRNAGAAITLTSGGIFLTDRFQCFSNNDGVMTGQQDTSAPSGFIKSIKFTTTTEDSSLAATQYAEVQQNIEGLNVADLAWGTASAVTITVSFWVRSSLTGAFGGAIRNSANDRSYAFSYSISTANTWEQKSVTIAGDTSGTWLTTNGIGLKLCFGMGAGSTYSGTAGVWTASALVQPTGATSVVGTNGATFYITGVQLEVGSTATSFDYRPYGTELALCQRYYFKQQATGGDAYFGSGFNTTTTRGEFLTTFPVVLRTAPTALEQSGTAGNYRVTIADTNVTCSAVPTFIGAELFSARTRFEVSSGLTAGQGSFGRSVNSSAYLAWSAEL